MTYAITPRTRWLLAGVLAGCALILAPGLARAADKTPLPPGAISRLGHVDLGVGADLHRTYEGNSYFTFLRKGNVVAYPTPRGIVLFDIDAGRVSRRVPGTAEVHRVDDDHVLVCEEQGDTSGATGGTQLSLWDLRPDLPTRVYSVPMTMHPPVKLLSADAKRLVVLGPNGKQLRVHDAKTGKQLAAFDLGDRTIVSLALSNTGKYIVAFEEQKRAVLVWSVSTRKTKWIRPSKEVTRWLNAALEDDRNLSAAFSADAKTLALLVGYPGTEEEEDQRLQLLLIRSTSGKLLRRLQLTQPEDGHRPEHIVLSRDGALLFIDRRLGGGSVIDTRTGEPPAAWRGVYVDSEEHEAYAAVFSADGSRLAVAFTQPTRSIRVWDTRTAKELSHAQGFRAEPLALRFSPDGARLTSVWAGAMTRVTSVAEGRVETEVATAAPSRPTGQPTEERAAPGWRVGRDLGLASASQVLVGGALGVAEHDLSRPGTPRTLPTGPVVALALVGGGARIAVSTLKGIATWDRQTRKRLAEISTEEVAVALAASVDGTRLAASFLDEVRVYELPSGKEVRLLSTPAAPAPDEGVSISTARVVAFSPNGAALCVAEDIWNTKTWKKLVTLPTKGEGELTAVAFSPDSTLVAVGALSGRVGIFDASGKALRTFEGHVAPVTCLAWSKDGKRLASGSDDTTIIIWDVSGL